MAADDKCVVGCKLPHGLNLDLVTKKGDEKTGVATEYMVVKLNGSNSARIVGGYGLTANVPRALFEEWLRTNAHRPFVRNGAVFMQLDASRAEDAAKERRGERTGLEAIDPTDKEHPANRGLVLDKDAAGALNRARAESPERNRQVRE